MTRVARVTGLDRSGIEVACAVRPLGHVLQVANGKGEGWDEARASALSEAAELWAAERPRELVHGSARELPDAWEPPVVSRNWKSIVLHHSATSKGDVPSIDAAHRRLERNNLHVTLLS